ncbi:DUF2892 domain-containing protein [Alicyclobacillus curvatus]|jgi:hypothetical protein|nr:DUF2892 domain-containing protein [Alicyclobacillus curvatus]
MLPSTMDRVQQKTAPEVNRWIQQMMQDNVAFAASEGRDRVGERIGVLRREWDIERIIELNAAAAVMLTTALGFTKSRVWFAASGVIAGFLFQHALQGWCPPIPVLRHLGVRTASEIQAEITALKALRGDFSATSDPDEATLQAAH